jgi:hypothetical protein
LWAWGYNGEGELGLGDTTQRTTPVQVGTETKWVSVAAGGYHTIGVKSDGTLWAWGYNGEGELGLGDTTQRTTPVQVGTETKWVSVAAGGYHTIGVKSDGTLWAWGYNGEGELGLGDTTDRTTPVQVVVTDTTAPTTTATASDHTLGNWTNLGTVSVTLSADDGAGSGITAGYPKYCVDTTDSCTPDTSGTSLSITCSSGSTCTQYVRYQSKDNAGNTEDIKSSTVRQDLLVPSDGTLSGTPSETSISLSWTSATDSGSGVASYKLVYLAGGTAPSDCTGTALYAGANQNYTHTGLSASTTYSYRVCAYDAVGNVSTGATATVTTTAPTIPSQPSTISLSNMKTTGPTITWSIVSNAVTYHIYRSEDGTNWTLIGSVAHPANTYTDTGAVKSNTTYYWAVTAVNAAGEAPVATAVTGRTALLYGWNMISAPVATGGQAATTVYGSWATWIYTWIPTNNIDPDNSGYWQANPAIVPGEGQLVWVNNDTTVVTATGSANPTAVTVTLEPGWNLIGSHIQTNLNNIGANFRIDGSSTLSAAITGGIIGGDIYWWNGSTYESMNITLDLPPLEPWKGYWILNMDSVSHTLTIQGGL